MKKLRFFDSLKFVRFVVAVVVATLILNVAHAATLPTGYTELEYIEGTGTQYIDTGLTGFNTGNWEIYVKWMSTNATQNTYAYIAGVYKSESHNTYRVIAYSQAGYRYWVNGNSKASGGSVSVDGAVNEIHEATIKNGSVVFDGTIYETPNKGTVLPSDSPLYVLGRSKISSAKARIYSVRVTKDGVVQAEFIPAQNSSGVVGLYDTKRNTFYTNSDTEQDAIGFIAGEWQIKIATTRYSEEQFEPVQNRLSAAVNAVEDVVTQTMSQAQAIDTIATTKQTRPNEGCTAKYCLLVEDEQGVPHWYPIAGANGVAHALPAGYTELQYIESTGTQYIDTGIKGNNNTSVEIRMRFPATSSADSSGRIFGARTNATTNGFAFGTSTAKIDTPLWFVSYGNQAYKNYTVSNYLNTWHKLAMQQNVLNVDDVTVATFTPETFETELNLLLFGYINSGTGTTVTNTGRYQCSYFKLWNGNTLVRDFVPAKNSSGVVGMYDLADPNPSTAFYTNAGTGTFVAGPDM